MPGSEEAAVVEEGRDHVVAGAYDSFDGQGYRKFKSLSTYIRAAALAAAARLQQQ